MYVNVLIKLSILMAIFPVEPGLSGFIGAEADGSGDDSWSYKSKSRHQQTNTTQAGCCSSCPTNSVKALKENFC